MARIVAAEGELHVALYFEDTVVRHRHALTVVLEFENKGDKPVRVLTQPELRLEETIPIGVKVAPVVEKKDKAERREELFYPIIVMRLPEGAMKRLNPLYERKEAEIPAKSSHFVKIMLPQECFAVGPCKIKVLLLKGKGESAVSQTEEKTITCVKDEAVPDQAVVPKPAPKHQNPKQK